MENKVLTDKEKEEIIEDAIESIKMVKELKNEVDGIGMKMEEEFGRINGKLDNIIENLEK